MDSAGSELDRTLEKEWLSFHKTLDTFPHSFQLHDSHRLTSSTCRKVVHTLQSDLQAGLNTPLEEARTLNFLGYLHCKLGNNAQALDHVQRALDLQGQHTNIVSLANKAVILWRKDLRDQAATLVRELKSLISDPEFDYLVVRAKGELAFSYTRLGAHFSSKAVEIFKEVVAAAREPEVWLWMFGLALTERRALYFNSAPLHLAEEEKEEGRCLEVLHRLLTVIDKCQSNNLKAKSYAEVGHLIDAKWNTELQKVLERKANLTAAEACKKALDLDPKDCSVLWKCGKIFRHTGYGEDFVEHLQRSIELRPTATSYHHLGLAYKHLAKMTKRQRERPWTAGSCFDFRHGNIFEMREVRDRSDDHKGSFPYHPVPKTNYKGSNTATYDYSYAHASAKPGRAPHSQGTEGSYGKGFQGNGNSSYNRIYSLDSSDKGCTPSSFNKENNSGVSGDSGNYTTEYNSSNSKQDADTASCSQLNQQQKWDTSHQELGACEGGDLADTELAFTQTPLRQGVSEDSLEDSGYNTLLADTLTDDISRLSLSQDMSLVKANSPEDSLVSVPSARFTPVDLTSGMLTSTPVPPDTPLTPVPPSVPPTSTLNPSASVFVPGSPQGTPVTTRQIKDDTVNQPGRLQDAAAFIPDTISTTSMTLSGAPASSESAPGSTHNTHSSISITPASTHSISDSTQSYTPAPSSLSVNPQSSGANSSMTSQTNTQYTPPTTALGAFHSPQTLGISAAYSASLTSPATPCVSLPTQAESCWTPTPSKRDINALRGVHNTGRIPCFSLEDDYIKEAIEAFQKAVELSEGENVRAVYHLAVTYRSVGNLREARRWLDVITGRSHSQASYGPFDRINAYEQAGLVLREMSEVEEDEKTRQQLREEGEEKLKMALRLCSRLCQRLPALHSYVPHVWLSHSTLMHIVDSSQLGLTKKHQERAKLFQMIQAYGPSMAELKEILTKDTSQAENPDFLKILIENCVGRKRYDDALTAIETLIGITHCSVSDLFGDDHYRVKIYMQAGRDALRSNTASTSSADYFSVAFRDAVCQSTEESSGSEEEEDAEGVGEDDAWDVFLVHQNDTEVKARAVAKVMERALGLKVAVIPGDCTPGKLLLESLPWEMSRSRQVVALLGPGDVTPSLKLALELAALRDNSVVLLMEGGKVPLKLTARRRLSCPRDLLDGGVGGGRGGGSKGGGGDSTGVDGSGEGSKRGGGDSTGVDGSGEGSKRGGGDSTGVDGRGGGSKGGGGDSTGVDGSGEGSKRGGAGVGGDRHEYTEYEVQAICELFSFMVDVPWD
ncbi:uncharacterized protein [Littorina saxatilis]|uniref:uncharacterized protein n=1 Tax=Littorina saxatilis TaxID=31220 RepID=UPI0038B4CB94